MRVSTRFSLNGILGEDDASMFGFGAEETMAFEPFASLVMVQDEAGNPVSNAAVTLVYASGEPVARATTNDAGAARIATQVDASRKAGLSYRVDHPNLEKPVVVAGALSTGEEPTGIQVKLKKGPPVLAIAAGVGVLAVASYFLFFKK